MTRGAFYHHFKSKDEIIDAVTTRIFMGNNPFKAVEEIKDLNGIEKIKYFLSFPLFDDELKSLFENLYDKLAKR